MNFNVAKQEIRTNLRETLRRCGYFGVTNRFNGQTGYVRRLSLTQHYPRFHLFLNQETERIYQFSLHLDQKQQSYSGQRAHSADYDEDTVTAEMARILAVIKN